MVGREAARRVVERLQKEDPSSLSEGAPRAEDKIDLSQVNDETPPSEITRLGKEIGRRRLTADGLKKDEAQALVARLGLSSRSK